MIKQLKKGELTFHDLIEGDLFRFDSNSEWYKPENEGVFLFLGIDEDGDAAFRRV